MCHHSSVLRHRKSNDLLNHRKLQLYFRPPFFVCGHTTLSDSETKRAPHLLQIGCELTRHSCSTAQRGWWLTPCTDSLSRTSIPGCKLHIHFTCWRFSSKASDLTGGVILASAGPGEGILRGMTAMQ